MTRSDLIIKIKLQINIFTWFDWGWLDVLFYYSQSCFLMVGKSILNLFIGGVICCYCFLIGIYRSSSYESASMASSWSRSWMRKWMSPNGWSSELCPWEYTLPFISGVSRLKLFYFLYNLKKCLKIK